MLYLGLMLLFGWPLFCAYWRLTPVVQPAFMRWAMPLLAAAALALAALEATLRLANLLALPVSALDGDSLRWFLFELPAGRAALLRVTALLLLLGLLLRADALRTLRRPLPLLLAVVALSSLAWNGHAAAAGGWRLAAGITHLLAAGAWVGAIALLLALTCRHQQHPDTLLRALRGFAVPGTFIVSTLLLSGVFSYLSLGGTAFDLWTSNYGRLLLLKLGMVGGMLSLAAVHRWWLVPKLESTSGQQGAVKVLRHLRGSLTMDALLAVLVLACVAVLGTLDPAA